MRSREQLLRPWNEATYSYNRLREGHRRSPVTTVDGKEAEAHQFVNQIEGGVFALRRVAQDD